MNIEAIEAIRSLPKIESFRGLEGPPAPFYGKAYLSREWYTEKHWTDYSEDKQKTIYKWEISDIGQQILAAFELGQAND